MAGDAVGEDFAAYFLVCIIAVILHLLDFIQPCVSFVFLGECIAITFLLAQ